MVNGVVYIYAEHFFQSCGPLKALLTPIHTHIQAYSNVLHKRHLSMQTGAAKPLTFCLVDNPLYLHDHLPLHMARLIAVRLMLSSTASYLRNQRLLGFSSISKHIRPIANIAGQTHLDSAVRSPTSYRL